MSSNTSGASEIGKRITGLRKELDLTQEELAKRISVKRETVNQWENGVRQIKGPDIAALADALNTTCDYILRGISSENINIYRLTGFSEIAIKRLKKMRTRIQSEHAAGWINTIEECELKAINTLLELDYSILFNIYNFLFGEYDSFSLLYGERDDQEVFNKEVRLCNNNSPSGGIYIRANQMQSVFLLEIQNSLMKLQKLIQETPEKSNAKKDT